MSLEGLLTVLERFAPLFVTVVVTAGILVVADKSLRRHWAGNADAKFRFQLIMLALTFIAVIAVVIALPVNDTLRGQLLSLLGILLSAAIALSSTTFVGNIMAGIMLKAVRSARPGDFITVADLTGRITEMALLHTEIQTEFRDLMTVPNLYLVTQPIKIVRASGTVISAEVSLGYDVPRTNVAEVLCRAAIESGLKDPFVHVRELGDSSILYRVAGLLEDVESLISARSRLRESMLDALHAAEIEIVSPTFMNSRVYSDDTEFIPEPSQDTRTPVQAQAETVIFDKATEVASVEELKKKVESLDNELTRLAEDPNPDQDEKVALLEAKKASLLERVKIEQQRLLDAECADGD
ncbi:MAG: mechanosensitive ion channel family protein [Gammaproteobacteria bacterium]|nr:mechanosensitive ion channel family protein [Gammaproteobacteria bacterium]MDH3505729.1 mechanosensitive ion channel family protein [Gammaproteobacteria bacterium]